MDKALVSVVIPTYNRKRVISRAIDSCINQTYDNIEIIVCDDHSTDGTYEFVRDKYTSIENVKCCRTSQGKKGANAARNEGIRNATGQFIAFLDSDDYLLEDSIENRMNIMLKANCGLVYGDVYYRLGNESICKLIQYDDISQFEKIKYLMEELSLCITSSIMVRRDVFKNVGCLDESLRSWQDDDLVVSVGMKYEMRHCKRVVAVIVGSANSITASKENLYQGCAGIVKKYRNEIIKNASFIRYLLWRIRIISLWMQYREQTESTAVGKEIYRISYFIIYKLIHKYFQHM